MGYYAIVFCVDVLVTALCVLAATKLSFLKVEFKALLLIVLLVSVVSLVPMVGWLLGLILFIYLLMKVGGVELMDSIMVVIITKLISFAVVLGVWLALS